MPETTRKTRQEAIKEEAEEPPTNEVKPGGTRQRHQNHGAWEQTRAFKAFINEWMYAAGETEGFQHLGGGGFVGG